MRRLTTCVLACLLLACGGSGGGGDDGTTDGVGEPDTTPDGTDTTDAPDTSDPAGDDPGEMVTECTSDGDCDDDDPCTLDVCDDLACTHEPVDADDDGYPALEVDGTDCGGTDCDDGDDAVHPGADPDCDAVRDMDCDDVIDGDEDGDDHLDDRCPGGDDCDDADPDAFPGSVLLDCDRDRDCNGRIDADNDGDGQDDRDCGGTDCDDTNPDVYFAAPEAECDGIDTSCNGFLHPTEDADGDTVPNALCAPAGVEPDCDDDDDQTYPGAAEICDGVDQDCDGTWTDGGADDDGDDHLDAACGGDDCDDTEPLAWTGAPELCDDGVDNDCDGLENEPTLLADPQKLSVDGSNALDPSVVWTGSGYGVFWADSRGGVPDIYLMLVDEDGSLPGSEIRLTTEPSSSYRTTAVWTGSEMAVVYSDDRDGSSTDLYMTRTTPDGAKVGSDVRLTSEPHHSIEATALYTGSEIAVTWQDSRDGGLYSEIYFARFAPDGAKVGSDVRLTNGDGWSDTPGIAWTGSEYGIGWVDEAPADGVYFLRLDAAGTPIGSEVTVIQPSYQSEHPVLGWTGSEFLITWEYYGGTATSVVLARLGADGAVVASDTSLVSGTAAAASPASIVLDDRIAVTWVDMRSGAFDTYLAFFDLAGAPVSEEIPLCSTAGNTDNPAIAGSPGGVTVAWEDYESFVRGTFETTVHLCP
jgi:hypothetical protein